MSTETILVTGAGGHLGRLVVEELLALRDQATKLVAGTRNVGELARLEARGVEVRRVDFDDAASLDAAFAGVSRLLLVSTNVFGPPRQRQHTMAIDAAKRARVEHVTYTSMPNPDAGSLVPFAPDHRSTEEALERSGLAYTALRNAWYTDNLLQSLPGVLAFGKWFGSAGNGRVANVTRADCARVAARVLTANDVPEKRYDVTGGEALTTQQIADIASAIFETTIDVVDLSDDAYTKLLGERGLPPPVVGLIVGSDANTRIGKFDVISDTVERWTGRTPESLRSFLVANAASIRAAATAMRLRASSG
ncbi:NADPH:quinone oxidoreductase 2 [Labilithrix luteola]|uniref:NADPH:quinone oxidoreductase 2 n=1 Tax=Labilithrix luteola TaxID=1391654 RepID=A0A0K1Q1T0_9BACT|nr:SDR family oxidoreductase [Labilithrix luteola]AKU99745.1 NADPH:quinone oxidoreductase 2 [Labilithrix luteola]